MEILSNNFHARPNHEFSSFEKKYRRPLNVSLQPIKANLTTLQFLLQLAMQFYS
jgi:hypothetical protein